MSALQARLDFILEADKLKTVIRRSWLTDESRLENSAEHQWHASLTALTLVEYAGPGVEIDRVLRMLMLHDLVEIDAGDTFLYDTAAAADQAAREQAAADRIFGLLPLEQGQAYRAIWDEFEAAESPSARFAKAVDRAIPMLLNLATDGRGWRDHNVRLDQVLSANWRIEAEIPELWAWIRPRLDDAVTNGWLRVPA